MESLAISFIWNYKDETIVKKIIEYTTQLLTTDSKNPFSRNINLPIFYYKNSEKNELPPNIKLEADLVLMYVFIGMHSVADDNWEKYINNLVEKSNYKIIPIALDETALNMPNINSINFIRLYEYIDYKYENFFISFAHEMYRYVYSSKMNVTNRSEALKIFISHAKDGNIGQNVAYQLKQLIDNTFMNRFFDTFDIAPGYNFSDEIVNNIKKSSVVIINSDIYSSRYWCQREIQCSKENNRPMIEVDLIENGVDRKYPYASNLPVIRVNVTNNIVKEDLYRILEGILIETIRYNYAGEKLLRIKKLLNNQTVKVMCRPPELFDLQSLIEIKKEKIVKNYDTILYPDPPLYSEELFFFKTLGINIYTPITLNLKYILRKSIGVSISEPSKESLFNIGQNTVYIKQLSQMLARYLLGNGAILIYGGDLRPNGFTKNLIMEAEILNTRLKKKEIKLINYVSWPIYLKDSDETIKCLANHREVLSMKKVDISEQVSDNIDSSKFILPDNVENSYIWSCCLTKMREEMIKETDIRIFAGGRASGYKGKMPGILEELLISIEKGIPIYLLGGFGGIVSDICSYIENGVISNSLTKKWQIENNENYSDLIKLYEQNGEKIDYLKILNKIKNMKLSNGLSNEENIKLFNTVYIGEAICLILKGLKNIYRE